VRRHRGWQSPQGTWIDKRASREYAVSRVLAHQATPSLRVGDHTSRTLRINSVTGRLILPEINLSCGLENRRRPAGGVFFRANNYEMGESVTYVTAARSCCSRPNGSRRCLSPKVKSIKLLRALTSFTKPYKTSQI
jgi:hypothetical protein